MYIDTSHELSSDYSEIVIVDKGIDSVDLKILRQLKSGDVIVTSDYGLASLVLSKGAKAISFNGLIYSELNIEQLLFDRFLCGVSRRANNKFSKIKKRTNLNDLEFRENFKITIS